MAKYVVRAKLEELRLRLLDELNREWVEAWKKAVGKKAETELFMTETRAQNAKN